MTGANKFANTLKINCRIYVIERAIEAELTCIARVRRLTRKVRRIIAQNFIGINVCEVVCTCRNC